jgi:hypothetical protein
MSPALFTTGQSRWALHIVLGLLSAVAIASSAPPSAGGERLHSGPDVLLIGTYVGATMFSGDLGDIRGIAVILGSVGLGGVLVLSVLLFQVIEADIPQAASADILPQTMADIPRSYRV